MAESRMKLVVGLGNPGKRYERTRHNVGFRVIDELVRRWPIEVNRRGFGGYFGSGRLRDVPVGLLTPTTYMNRSGRSVREAMTFYKLKLEDLLVIVDDLDLPLGELIAITGVSGSGKSSLAFDTVYAEGQRRYVETFSPYARQFLDRMDRPRADRIEGDEHDTGR